jgi:hypothetical protein
VTSFANEIVRAGFPTERVDDVPALFTWTRHHTIQALSGRQKRIGSFFIKEEGL